MSCFVLKLKKGSASVDRILVNKDAIVLGSRPPSQILLKDTFVSGRQARLFLDREGHLLLEDLKSRNGTLVNGVKIHKVELKANDVVRFGSVEWLVLLENGQEEKKRRNEQAAIEQDVALKQIQKMEAYKASIMPEFSRVMNRLKKPGDSDQQLEAKVEDVIDRLLLENVPSSGIDKRTVKTSLLHDVLGLGALEEFLADDNITEIMINGEKKIFIEQAGRLTFTGRTFASREQLYKAIDRIVAPLGRHVDESSPYVDARLSDGSRVNIIIPPLSIDGPVVTIRKFSKKGFTIRDLINFGALTDEMGEFLELCVRNRFNVLISGGTGSGKTTLLNALSSFIPDDERIVTIEDSAELKLPQFHVVRLETRPANIEGKGQIGIRQLVINSLRMRPDRIIVGECRGEEALDMVQAMNTGHDGSLTTAHANSPRDAIRRLEVMCLMGDMDLPLRAIRDQIASAIQLIVQISRFRDGSRKVVRVSEITGMEKDIVTIQDLFEYVNHGYDEEGRSEGIHRPTGNIPALAERLAEQGVIIDRAMFCEEDTVK